MSKEELKKYVIEVVGALRAESLGDKVFEYFAEPEFFPRLQSPHNVLIKGGRGTGKTTLLRCLSYQGQAALAAPQVPVDTRPFFGLFWRINTNRVAAFDGPELTVHRWRKLFSHYVNLELTELLLELLAWLEEHGLEVELDGPALEGISVTLNLPQAETVRHLRNELRRARAQFEARLNNIADSDQDLGLSVLGVPVDRLIALMRAHPVFAEKRLFFLIDEYENLLDYQQEVFNTLIKHAPEGCAYKIGVKELGFRCRTTINQNEFLDSPADFSVINITDELSKKKFDSFAERLLAGRIAHVPVHGEPDGIGVRQMFVALSHEEEAERLGVAEHNQRFAERIASSLDTGEREMFDALGALQQYFVSRWSSHHGIVAGEIIRGLHSGDQTWIRRFGNHAYALLFAIRGGKPGRKKYYAGWSTICALSNANTRYLLELVSGMLEQHLDDGNDLATPLSVELQTDVAYSIARKNLQLLERETDHAASLVKVVLGLGRVFEVMAADPMGHASEVTQFSLPSVDVIGKSGDIDSKITGLINEAVNALAIVRYPATKLQEPEDLRSYDYALHPMFAALFEFSHRRKRKIVIHEDELLGLVKDPKWAIARILLRQKRDPSSAPLPDQLRLFSTYYA